MSEPLLSICLITYNHAKYIRESIEGVLMQKVDFFWELIIADDFSTDGTREIVLEYKEKYPEFIKLIFQERNVGAAQNFEDLIFAPSSKYIAYFEGDDYWTDPYKLQKQVDFLASHPECVICFHDVRVVYEDGSKESHNCLPAGYKEISTLDDLLTSNFIPTCSVIFKNGLIGEFPEWFYELKIGDWPLHILNAQHGKIGYINNTMAVYRIHSKGVFSGMEYLLRAESSLHAREVVYKNINKKDRKILGEYIFYKSYLLAHRFFSKGDSTRSKTYLAKCLRYIRYKSKVSWVDFIKLYIVVWIPFVYNYYRVARSVIKRAFLKSISS